MTNVLTFARLAIRRSCLKNGFYDKKFIYFYAVSKGAA